MHKFSPKRHTLYVLEVYKALCIITVFTAGVIIGLLANYIVTY